MEPLGTLGTVEPVKLLEGHPVLAKKRYFDVHTDGWAEEQVHFQECAQNSHNFSDLPCLSLWVWQFLNTWILYLRTFWALNVNKETHLSRISIFAWEVLSFRSWCNSTPKPLEKDSWQKTPLVTLMQPRKVQVLCSENQCANLIWKSDVMCMKNIILYHFIIFIIYRSNGLLVFYASIYVMPLECPGAVRECFRMKEVRLESKEFAGHAAGGAKSNWRACSHWDACFYLVSLSSNLAASYQLEIFNDLHLYFISAKIPPCLLCDRHEAQSWLQGASFHALSRHLRCVTHRLYRTDWRLTIDGRPRKTTRKASKARRKPRPIFVLKPSHVVWWNCLVPWRQRIHFDKIRHMCRVNITGPTPDMKHYM